LVTDSHRILARWRKHFSQLLNLHEFNDVRQTAMHTAEPLAPEPSACDFVIATEKIKRRKSPGIDQIPTELIKAGCKRIRPEIHKIDNSVLNKEEFPEEWKESIIVPKHKKCDKTIIIEAYQFLQLHIKFYPTSCCQF